MPDISLDDARPSGSVARLLEDSWRARARIAPRRELLAEAAAGGVFLLCAVPLALAALAAHRFDAPLAALLVAVYAVTSRTLRFPIGAGYVVPSYVVLVPMLLLLPPGTVPLLTAAGLALGAASQAALRRGKPEDVVFAVPDAWHALGPSLVLLLAGRAHGDLVLAAVYALAFASGCLLDLAASSAREWAIEGTHPQLQLRVLAQVWIVDACIAPLGLLVAHAMRHRPAELLLLLPLNLVLMLVARDRNAHIERAQTRLELVAHERTRLQMAVQRFGEAISAKLDLDALANIVLRGSVEALDGDCGRFSAGRAGTGVAIAGTAECESALTAAIAVAEEMGRLCQLERDGAWAIALPLSLPGDALEGHGAVAVARAGRAFRPDEQAVLRGLAERARDAASDIIVHERLRSQAFTDPLTGLGNRRRLAADMELAVAQASIADPLVLVLFDLDGFKAYNDTFGHQAGDAMLARLGERLAAILSEHEGSAYRLGGDEFCALVNAGAEEADAIVGSAVAALGERGENFELGASFGTVTLPMEAHEIERALQIADERMYSHKRSRSSLAGDQAQDLLVQMLRAKHPALGDTGGEVPDLAADVGRELGMAGEQIELLRRAAELRDIGKIGIPDAILGKAGTLTEAERGFLRQHTVLGARILGSVPALGPVAEIVRATHERWDGAGYPDGLAGESIPVAARVISVCAAYAAIGAAGAYRAGREHGNMLLRAGAGREFDPAVVAALLAVVARRDGGAVGAELPDGASEAA